MSQSGRRYRLAAAVLGALMGMPASAGQTSPSMPDPLASLALYDGEWSVRADHPWSGAAPGAIDRLSSRCHRFTAYFACEQTVDGQTANLIVYTVDEAGRVKTQAITRNGLAGGRGDLTLVGSHWTYLDKPAPSLQGPWSRTENFVRDHDHIRFEQYQSDDNGKTWRLTNSGEENRQPP